MFFYWKMVRQYFNSLFQFLASVNKSPKIELFWPLEAKYFFFSDISATSAGKSFFRAGSMSLVCANVAGQTDILSKAMPTLSTPSNSISS